MSIVHQARHEQREEIRRSARHTTEQAFSRVISAMSAAARSVPYGLHLETDNLEFNHAEEHVNWSWTVAANSHDLRDVLRSLRAMVAVVEGEVAA